MGHLYIFGTVMLAVYDQIVFKWQVDRAGPFPEGNGDKALYLLKLLVNPWVISCFLAALLATLFWMAALARFELSYAFPFMSLTFVFVLIMSAIFFNETVTATKWIGIVFIMVGIFIGSRG